MHHHRTSFGTSKKELKKMFLAIVMPFSIFSMDSPTAQDLAKGRAQSYAQTALQKVTRDKGNAQLYFGSVNARFNSIALIQKMLTQNPTDNALPPMLHAAKEDFIKACIYVEGIFLSTTIIDMIREGKIDRSAYESALNSNYGFSIFDIAKTLDQKLAELPSPNSARSSKDRSV